ncbi:DegT/DnrJ/EryC1/StrS family aminotransferase [Nocardioides sambongensis]|uniref:DegT/DnrJ/EryC1/StrS family aminotransferase n=1 Tax=Nocardioides sambongensis TaxID=2589074 RepID=UPI00112A7F28|nr:DegT/DnrJ/EryC1/StrS family aminotransferase [Nocardioides sambongensis]
MKRIHVMQSWLGEEEIEAVREVLESGWVAQGPRVAEFEEQFAEAQQINHAVATSSCTAALHLALVVAGVPPDADVVVPSYSFIATANAPTYLGARPVFCDVDPVTGNVTAETVEAVLTPRTAAVIAVDQGGVPVDLAPLRALCDPMAIPVIEDAACAAGSLYEGQPVGAKAEAAAWSFHPHKILTTGEGGMLTTSNAAWAVRSRRLREHALSSSAGDRHGATSTGAEEYPEIGFNYRMTDLQAAVGLVQLGRLEQVVRRRRELAAVYSASIAGIPGLRAVADPPHGRTNFQSFWVEVGEEYPLSRDQLLATLAEVGVSARRGIMAAHLEPAYAAPGGPPLPATEHLTRTTLILPLFHQMLPAQQRRVIDVLHAPLDIRRRRAASR